MPEWWDVQYDGPKISVHVHWEGDRPFAEYLAWRKATSGKFWTRQLWIGNEHDPPDCVDYLRESGTSEM